MAKALLYSLLLLCASWALAENNPNPSSNAASQAGSMAEQTTVQGCLSGAGGSYTLTDSTGKTYQLAGDTSKLADHVGHKIEVTGTTSSAGSPSSGTATASGASSQQTLNVSSFKHISDTCTASSSR